MERLVAIALGVSAMSMFLSCAALWPHSQMGLSRARNGFLWVIFAFLVVGSATVSFRKMKNRMRPTIRSELVTNRRSDSRLLRNYPAPSMQPQADRLDLRPRSGFAALPTHERLYQAYQSE